MLYMPENVDAFKFYEFGNPVDSTQVNLYFGISGATHDTDIGSLIFNYNVEYIPAQSVRPFIELNASSGAYAT